MHAPGPLDHIALVVREAARTAEFLRELFDAEVIAPAAGADESETRVHLGNLWVVLPQADVERPLRGDHVAFRVSSKQLHGYAHRLDALGHEYQMRGGTALYFVDFDNHVFELEAGARGGAADAVVQRGRSPKPTTTTTHE